MQQSYVNKICNMFNVYTYTFLGLEKAHAFVPTHSEIHFNDFENFTNTMGQADGTTSIFYVAAHEIGEDIILCFG